MWTCARCLIQFAWLPQYNVLCVYFACCVICSVSPAVCIALLDLPAVCFALLDLSVCIFSPACPAFCLSAFLQQPLYIATPKLPVCLLVCSLACLLGCRYNLPPSSVHAFTAQ